MSSSRGRGGFAGRALRKAVWWLCGVCGGPVDVPSGARWVKRALRKTPSDRRLVDAKCAGQGADGKIALG